jgi:hypothetical protein
MLLDVLAVDVVDGCDDVVVVVVIFSAEPGCSSYVWVCGPLLDTAGAAGLPAADCDAAPLLLVVVWIVTTTPLCFFDCATPSVTTIATASATAILCFIEMTSACYFWATRLGTNMDAG